MKVLVLGSGVVGVTSAWYLNRAGHEVTVVDRQPEPGMETSLANGGQVSWGAGGPWAAPGIPLTALKWMLRPHSPLVLRARLDPALWTWLFRMLANCTHARYAVNRERMLRLSRYSHECLAALRRETGIRYDERASGVLELYRTARELEQAWPEAALLQRWGVPCRMLDRAACVAHEPALRAAQEKIAGGLLLPEDESGDCLQFTRRLAQLAEKNGVRFTLSTKIERLVADGNRLARVDTDQGELSADAYVLACGSYSPLLARPVGVRLPVYPVKGYSATIEIEDANAAPAGTLTDVAYKIVVTRLGNTLRGAGTAELAGYDLRLRPARCATITHVIGELFPGAGDLAQARYWCGLRPMTPDNPPLLGPTPYKNLVLNTGHGTLGWTMACGAGRVTTDIVSGREPEIDLEGLTLARFS
ncbi:MAG TPA: D-amino acid dehydrogenase [Burkholderiales bacterium]|nr:D-amino acid dehydrogenase [Burkholderiales bacterium]HYA36905.1 D-amino acid dehydrogenase [Candidatus Methylomirabilis sp.]